MDLLCEVCDRPIIENESEYYNYLARLRKNMIKMYIKNILFLLLIWMRLIKY